MNARLRSPPRATRVQAPFLLCGRALVSRPPLLQPKLTIGQPDDRYEQEADRVAEQVMRLPEPGIQRQPT